MSAVISARLGVGPTGKSGLGIGFSSRRPAA